MCGLATPTADVAVFFKACAVLFGVCIVRNMLFGVQLPSTNAMAAPG